MIFARDTPLAMGWLASVVGAASPSETDIEGLEAAGRRTNLLVRPPHIAAHFGTNLLQQQLNLRRRAFDDELDPAVGEILDEADHSQPRGERPDCIAEPHPLNVAGVVDFALFAFGSQGGICSTARIGLFVAMLRTVKNETNLLISRRFVSLRAVQSEKYTEMLPGFPAAVRS